MNKKTIEKTSEYLEVVENLTSSIYKSNEDDLLLFRGQNVDEPLLPKIAREYELIRYYGNPFRYDLFTYEKLMLEDFKRRSRPYLTKEPLSDWDWLTIAQHHGMQSRFLDWTENPLVGLFFALEPNPKSNISVVWILRIGRREIVTPTSENSPFKVTRTRIFMPNIVSNRLVSQAGWFTVHVYNKRTDKFIPLDKNKSYKSKLIKVIIEGSKVDMNKHLDLCGVNSSTMFTDLDGLCKHINIKRVLHDRYFIEMPKPISKSNKATQADGKA